MTRSTTFYLITMLTLFVLPGCATSKQDIPETGEQKTVIKESEAGREKTVIEESETAQAALECPPGTTEWCVRRFRHEKCKCVLDSKGRDIMETLPNPDWRKTR